MSFESIKKQYGEWLVEEYEGALTQNAAACYRTYLNALRKACAERFDGNELFDSLYQLYGSDEWGAIRSQCAQFIEEKRAAAESDREKKDWNNRRSAFHRYEEFIPYFCGDPDAVIEDVQVEQITPRTSARTTVRTGSLQVAPNLQYAETFTKKELVNKFLSRLKTQSRWYPDPDLLFPARLISAIFNGSNNNAWKNWMLSDLMNMRVLREDETYERFEQVENMTIETDGSISVKLNGNENRFKMFTHTAENNLVPFVTSAPRYISIDHIESMRTVMHRLRDSLPAFRQMTDCFNVYNSEQNGALDPRSDRIWAKALLQRFPELITDAMRSRIAHDLEKLDLEYELMEGHENSKKSATI